MCEAARLIATKTPLRPKLGIVLGSGLGKFASALSDSARIPYGELPGLAIPTVAGHRGEFVLGKIGSAELAVMSGRFHLYENYTAHEVTSGIRLFREIGVERVVLTNTSGGIHPALSKGALALISDQINLQGANPLAGGNAFPDMTEAYSTRLRSIARAEAARLGIHVFEGVYAGVLGPSYETPAEIRFLKVIGADMVGMSTVQETIAAVDLGIEVLGISCVTNVAAGLSKERPNHDDVLATARAVSADFVRLLGGLVPELAAL